MESSIQVFTDFLDRRSDPIRDRRRVYINDGIYSFVDTSLVMADFSSPARYEKFVLDQKDHQRVLGRLKHLLLEG